MGELRALPPPDDSFGPFVVGAFRAGGLELPRATVVAFAIELCANLMRTGRYLSVIPQFWLQLPDRHPFIRKLRVDLPITGAPIGIIMLKNRAPSAVVQRFIDCAREVAKPLTRRN
jgi:DNA-binding transcriptional LysR family regulator